MSKRKINLVALLIYEWFVLPIVNFIFLIVILFVPNRNEKEQNQNIIPNNEKYKPIRSSFPNLYPYLLYFLVIGLYFLFDYLGFNGEQTFVAIVFSFIVISCIVLTIGGMRSKNSLGDNLGEVRKRWKNPLDVYKDE